MTTSPYQSEPNPYQAPTEPRMAPGSASGGGQWDTSTVIELLSQTRPWVLFLSIVAFICSGLMVVGGFIGGLAMLALGSRGGGGLVIMVVYPIIGLVYFFPALYLFRFSQSIRDLRDSHDVAHLENALSAQKSFWRFAGIVTAVVLTLYAAIIVIAALAAFIGAMSR